MNMKLIKIVFNLFYVFLHNKKKEIFSKFIIVLFFCFIPSIFICLPLLIVLFSLFWFACLFYLDSKKKKFDFVVFFVFFTEAISLYHMFLFENVPLAMFLYLFFIEEPKKIF